MNKEELKRNLLELLREKGAVLCGVADMTGIAEGEMTTGVSVAVPVPEHIVEDLKTAPTLEYQEMYHTLNAKLNDIVTTGAEYLQSQGYQAFANTTHVTKTDENWKTPIPHKTFATRAGLGWIGKSCILVTKEYGSAIRISSLLTDAPLPADEPVTESKCGGCDLCVRNCPGQALKGKMWTAGMSREELFNKEKCYKAQVERMKKATGVENDLCGLCFAVCPYTQKHLNKWKESGEK